MISIRIDKEAIVCMFVDCVHDQFFSSVFSLELKFETFSDVFYWSVFSKEGRVKTSSQKTSQNFSNFDWRGKTDEKTDEKTDRVFQPFTSTSSSLIWLVCVGLAWSTFLDFTLLCFALFRITFYVFCFVSLRLILYILFIVSM